MASDHTTAASGAASPERAAFEAWALSEGWTPSKLARGRSTQYSWAALNEAWSVWQARAALAAPAAQEAEPPTSGNPPDCDPELYAHGVSVGLFDLPKWTAEALCRGVSAATGARVDWHYVGGRVHVKALPALPAPRPQADAGAAQLPNPEDPAVSAAIDKILAGYVWPATAKAYAYAGFEAARQLLDAAPQAPAAPTAAAAEQPGMAHDDEVLPLLVRDIANDLGRTALDVIGALRALGLGNYSVNTAVTKAMATRLRQHFEAQAPAAGAAPSQHITQPYTVAEIRERVASGDYSAELMLQHALLHLGPGAAPTDAAPLLSPAEQKWLLADPTAIRSLMTSIDVNHSDYSSAVEPGEIEPWPPKRWTELRELGRAIIAVDPECFDEQTLRDFGFPVPTRAAAPAQEAPARTMHITELHGTYGWDGKVRGAWSRSYDAPMPAPDAPDAPRLIGVDMAAGPDATAYWTVNAAPTDAAEIAANVCRQVAELPDRNSPEDWPDAMLVTADELRVIVLEAIADASAPAQEAEDAARWRHIREEPHIWQAFGELVEGGIHSAEKMDALVDAARARQEGQT